MLSVEVPSRRLASGRMLLPPSAVSNLRSAEIRLLSLQPETIDLRITVHGVHLTVREGKTTEVDPSVYGISALIKHLASFGVESVEHGALGVFLALQIVQHGLLGCKDQTTFAGLVHILAVGQGEH